MKILLIAVVSGMLTMCGCATGRLPYEGKNIFALASEVVGLPPDFRESNEADAAMLRKRFPPGTEPAEIWRELLKIRRAHPYATAVNWEFNRDDLILWVFRYQRDDWLPLTEKIEFHFTFADHRLTSISFTVVTEDW
jgi:hypothetical protein